MTPSTTAEPSAGTAPPKAVAEPDNFRDPQVRLRALFDDGTLRLIHRKDSTGVISGRGEIDGQPAVAFATDPTLMGGAMGYEGCARIAEAIDTAVADRVPVIGLWHCGGARIAPGKQKPCRASTAWS